jgi:hypothetical protein
MTIGLFWTFYRNSIIAGGYYWYIEQHMRYVSLSFDLWVECPHSMTPSKGFIIA